MRIVVTGGAGFIGSHVADAALAAGHEVLVVDDLSSGKRHNVPAGARFEQLDIRKAEPLLAAFRAFKPEVISHQAAQTSVSVSTREPLRDAEVNVLGSLNVMEAALSVGAGRLVFASTGGAIYGEIADGRRAREEDPALPLSPYAVSKLAVEGYMRAMSVDRGLVYTVLRYANVYGPRQDPHGEAGVVAIFAQRLQAKLPIQINAKRELGDAGCIRDYVYVSDVVRANLAALEGTLVEPVINICTGEETSTAMLADQLERHFGRASERRAGPRRPGDVERSVLDPVRCRKAIGDATSLAQGLAQTAAWFVAQR
ncbi:MAG: NAD-dependent epimerase/dehydratase family protein [Deltaproteobacteria bacterium]|nr:NAD-dependent epimerase/dehydratase family protein [Deltaproteobacteria bacterium]